MNGAQHSIAQGGAPCARFGPDFRRDDVGVAEPLGDGGCVKEKVRVAPAVEDARPLGERLGVQPVEGEAEPLTGAHVVVYVKLR